MATDLTIYEGEDKAWNITISDSGGTPIDITGYSFLFVVKAKASDEDPEAIIKKIITSHPDPTNGVTQISVLEADTEDKHGKYLYDLQMEDDSGNRSVILKKAKFTVEQRIGDDFS